MQMLDFHMLWCFSEQAFLPSTLSMFSHVFCNDYIPRGALSIHDIVISIPAAKVYEQDLQDFGLFASLGVSSNFRAQSSTYLGFP